LICPEKYFKKALSLVIKRRGADEDTLTRLVATRADVDLKKQRSTTKGSVIVEQAIKKNTVEIMNQCFWPWLDIKMV
jgi:hypothetical protein